MTNEEVEGAVRCIQSGVVITITELTDYYTKPNNNSQVLPDCFESITHMKISKY